jgi:hypothetical protein
VDIGCFKEKITAIHVAKNSSDFIHLPEIKSTPTYGMKALLITALAIIIQFTQLNAQTTTPENTGKDQAAETIGVLTATTLYYSYRYMSGVVDGFGWIYEVEDVEEVVGEQIAILGRIQEKLNDLIASDFLQYEEILFIAEVNRCCDYLKQHASSILTYAKDSSDASRDAYLASDEQTWKFMSQILGLN